MKFQNNIGSNGWYFTSVPFDAKKEIDLKDKAVDYIVVGAGFVGMAAARHLAILDPQAEILLLDATKIGLGTAGRCSGFVIDTPHKGDLIHDDVNLHKKAIEVNRKAIAWMSDNVKSAKINCDWSVAGKFQVAASKKTLSMLKSYQHMLENAGEEYEYLSREELSAKLGTDHYLAGIYTPNCVLIQPAAYLKGMAASMPPNVRIYENTIVKGLKSNSAGVEIKTQNANLRCKRLVLAVNIYAREFGYLKNRLLPIITYASMTAPLTEEQQKHFKGTYNWGLTSADKGGTTLRLTADKRFVIRNHYTYTPSYKVSQSFIQKIQKSHYICLQKRYPHIGTLKFEHTWGGVCAVSRNFGFFVGEIDKNIFSALCHSGVGAARGTLAGKALAEKIILGKSPDLKLLSKSHQPGWNPPEPFLGIGVSARLAIQRWMSRKEL